jgi:hypothetical protein
MGKIRKLNALTFAMMHPAELYPLWGSQSFIVWHADCFLLVIDSDDGGAM